ncbi:MAG: hypothetical protein VB073_02155 [Proteiniphilum sp.]|nr:hypothetical protein [Proteiniphilum sp.]
MESGAEEIIKKELVKGFDKKITPDNVSHLGDKYLLFCKKLLPNTNLSEIENLLRDTEVRAMENFVRVFANTQIDENECLSPDGVQRIIEFSTVSNCDLYSSKKEVESAFGKNIEYWKIENSIFEVCSSDFILKPKEECYFRSSGSVSERKQVTQRIDYGGPRARIKIAKGISYNLGSIAASTHKVLKDIDLGYGNVNITNKNILYKGAVKSLSIPLSSIIDIEFYVDACILYRNRGNPFVCRIDNQDKFNRYLRAML